MRRRSARSLVLAMAAMAVAAGLAPAPARAEDAAGQAGGAGTPGPPGAAETEATSDGFDADWALGAYATGWEGSYLGGGIGGRIRWQAFEQLGVEVFAEHLLVESEGGLRHDHPVGFNLYLPLRLAADLQLRPLFGFCAVLSFMEPEEEGAPGAQDVLFGVHGGAGIEWALFRDLSVFLEAQAVGWLGHDRTSQGWTGDVGEELTPTGVVQAAAGLQIHL